MARGVVTHHILPCGLQTLGCHHLPRHNKNNACRRPQRRLSCKATINRVDRRDVLLGGAAAAGLAATQHRDSALASPIRPPDLGTCRPVQHDVAQLRDINCCPPYCPTTEIVDFEPPPASSPLRVRRAAHLLVDDEAYLDKYETAVARMKALPDDDPRSFSQQWRVHCAYCEGAYPQAGIPDREIQIHSSWLFFPWHRLYLYFHERILGKLIGDDTFALPFWNWDAPDGMTFPTIYTNEFSLLYNKKRNPMHQPPVTVDLDYGAPGDNPRLPKDKLIKRNLNIMYRQMVSGAKAQKLFFGHRYCQGDKPNPGAGTIEKQPHNLVHNWTGDPRLGNCGEDMGVLGTAARDPVFFAHHGNIDRMWDIWKNHKPSPEWPANTDITELDWLDASFLFYDEEARPVRVRVRDCLDTTALRYTYQDVEIPWRDARPSPADGVPERADGPAGALFPRTLDNKTVRVEVRRERTSRNAKEKKEKEEVLVIKGIRIADHQRFVKFDVFVNAPAGGAVDAAAAQFAGSFALTPHTMRGSVETAATFGITELLDAIRADDRKTVVVSIVPRAGGDTVTIGGVSVDYIPIE